MSGEADIIADGHGRVMNIRSTIGDDDYLRFDAADIVPWYHQLYLMECIESYSY